MSLFIFHVIILLNILYAISKLLCTLLMQFEVVCITASCTDKWPRYVKAQQRSTTTVTTCKALSKSMVCESQASNDNTVQTFWSNFSTTNGPRFWYERSRKSSTDLIVLFYSIFIFSFLLIMTKDISRLYIGIQLYLM